MKPFFESRYIDPASNRISHIISLLGPALLLPWPAGCKGSRKKWKHLQLTDMSVSSHLAKLERAGNIGVALGRASNGLVTIDVDDEDYIERFLEANPLLRNTLRTTAQRGCNIWLRCTTDYPRSSKLRNRSGEEIGEWRADGNQTIVVGTHPTGAPYRFVVENPAIAINYTDVVWPDVIVPPDATESKRVRRVIEKEVVSVGGGLQIQASFSVDLITQVAPTDYHQNNTSLFKLARLAKSYENAIGRSATVLERQFVFDRWCLVARRFWRPELTRDDYYAEFLEACSYARMGLDENPIEVAVSRAKAAPLPQVQGFTDERIRLLVAICREIQQTASSFFLPTRKLGEILGAHWTQVARWLRALEVLRVIHLAPGEVRRRGGNRSPRYYYGALTRNRVGLLPTVKAVKAAQATPLQSPLLNGRSISNEPKESVPLLKGADVEI